MDQKQVLRTKKVTLSWMDFIPIADLQRDSYLILKSIIIVQCLKAFYEKEGFFFHTFFGVYFESVVKTVYEWNFAVLFFIVQNLLLYTIASGITEDDDFNLISFA